MKNDFFKTLRILASMIDKINPSIDEEIDYKNNYLLWHNEQLTNSLYWAGDSLDLEKFEHEFSVHVCDALNWIASHE